MDAKTIETPMRDANTRAINETHANARAVSVDEAQAQGLNEWLPQDLSPAVDIIKRATPDGFERNGTTHATTEDYYGIPLLKRPLWRWEIAFYFFFEGISAGAFLISSMADLFGKKRFRAISRAGYYISFLTLLPCPPLLVADLGRPERFHHMLRVWKPSSPMNLGAWALTGYSVPVMINAARQLTGDLFPQHETLKRASRLLPAPLVAASGIPFALTMTSYPGVLLSTTSTPVWTKSRFLGALFACSSISTGLAAVTLALAAHGDDNERAIKRLEKAENISSLCEGATLAAYLLTSGVTAEPLTSGKYAGQFWIGAVGAGLVVPAAMRLASSKRRKQSRASSVVSSLLTLAGGLALKWAVVHAGRSSAEDIAATHDATKPSASAPGWNAESTNANVH
ncbi:MAG: NrfD/PsrC family molybdoenzyme membrane anchor subunit [Pyrinomonadaceae bacterium]